MLDFLRKDLFAVFEHYHTLYSSHYFIRAVFKAFCKVARIEPAVADYLCRCLRVLIITEHDVRSLYGKLADPVGIGINYFDIHTDKRVTDVVRASVSVVMHYADGGGFGQPVTDVNAVSEAFIAVVSFRRKRRRSAENSVEPAAERSIDGCKYFSPRLAFGYEP